MSQIRKRYLPLTDLYTAYRKAKAEAFYENTHFHAIAFTRYERNLDRNLRRLRESLASETLWMEDAEWCGGFSYAPKSVKSESEEDGDGVFYRYLDPLEEWDRKFGKSGGNRSKAEFRLVITPSVDFQIVSALWIIKAGHRFEAALDPRWSFGNRLRRSGKLEDTPSGPRRPLNTDCIGLFAPYFAAYNKWRTNGLDAMKASLTAGDRILVITMDLQRFYHRVSPAFLLRDDYLKSIGVALNDDERVFTENLITAIGTWYRTTPDYKQRPQGAIPVGLSASKVIANVLLAEFDDKITSALEPVYYGRYVDDIFLVLKIDDQELTGDMVMQKLAAALPDILEYKEADADSSSRLCMHLPYAADSELVFAGTKQKVFNLSGRYGLDLVAHVFEQIRKQSSEHRLLADLPETAESMASRALLAQPNASLEPDALRKADVISVRRLGLSLLLRDVETYARDLRPNAWKKLRGEFYGLVHRHVLTPVGFFDFFAYVHRVFGLMVACGDFQDARSVVDRIAQVATLLQNTTTAGTDDYEAFRLCRQYYARALLQVALQASSVARFVWSPAFFRLLHSLNTIDEAVDLPSNLASARRLSTAMLYADWGRRPYRDVWLHGGIRPFANPRVPTALQMRRFLRLGAVRGFRKAAGLRIPYWPPLVFPTRPLSLAEITVAAPSLLHQVSKLRAVLFAFRGARANEKNGIESRKSENADQPIELYVQARISARRRIAVPSFLTTDAEWEAALIGKPSLSLSRYERTRRLVNQMMRERPRPHYIVFPECSLPLSWAQGIAHKLASRGISFLAGLEYRITPQGVRNDALISLTTKWPWYATSLMFLQHKISPSHEERRQLWKHGRKRLFKPPLLAVGLPVYVHGDFCFGVLLCSDLTNIGHRVRFQGCVDAVFVLEWNKDLDTFSFMIEAAAQDLHAYIVQVNNRTYGDSRIRVPRKKIYERDTVRVKGGRSDYFVTAAIDVTALRTFQSKTPAAENGDFKPVPIGYRMSSSRKP